MPTPAQEEETPVDKLISFYNAASPQPQSVVAPVVVSKNIPDELSGLMQTHQPGMHKVSHQNIYKRLFMNH